MSKFLETIEEIINSTKSAVKNKLSSKTDTNLYRNFDITMVSKDDESGLTDNIKIKINLDDSARWVDSGRKPGKMPPLKQIEGWCATKGIPKSAAFPIAKHISQFGIKPTPFLHLLTEMKEDLLKLGVEAIAKDIVNIIEKENKEINKK